MLFLHLLVHLVERLEELIFILLWELDAGDGLLLRWGVQVFDSARLISGWQRDCAPAALISFSLDDKPLVAYLLGAIIDV